MKFHLHLLFIIILINKINIEVLVFTLFARADRTIFMIESMTEHKNAYVIDIRE